MRVLTLIENGEVYAPASGGVQSVLLLDGRIGGVGAIERREVDRFAGAVGIVLVVVDASGRIVVPGLIDPHEHIIGGSGEKGFNSRSPALQLSEIVRWGITTVVATLASEFQRELFEDYDRLFRSLGVRHVFKLQIESRADAFSDRAVRVLEDATAVFFTGGDQLRITSQLGDSPIYDRVREIHEAGGLVVGTSAGASVMSETMMVSGDADESYRIGSPLLMAPGLGLIQDVVIDQHFAERGRVGRLLGAIAQNPRVIGIGIDENTAIVVDDQRSFEVIGDGAVYVLDASGVTYSNLTEERKDRTLSLFGVQIHVLSMGDRYDLGFRVPKSGPAEAVLERLGVE